MNRAGRQGGAGESVLSKEEAKLQKKGISNMSLEELIQWREVCGRNETNIKFKKSRRTWSESKKETEARIEILTKK